MPMPLRKIVIFANPKARTFSSTLLTGIENFLSQSIPTTLVKTEFAGHMKTLAAQYGSDKDTLVAVCGGDGSINETLNGLPDQGVMGIIPMGTANVVARELGIPLEPMEAAKVLLTGALKRLDIGKIGALKFLMVAGFGFDAHVAARVPETGKKLLGQFAYHLESICSFPTYKPPEITVKIDDRRLVEAQFVLFANMRRYGGGLFFAPDARHDDGLLDMVAFTKFAPVDVMKGVLGAWTRNGVPSETAQTIRGKVFEVSSDKPVNFQIDGEVLAPVSKVVVSVDPGKLTMVVP